jgi:hypothetical protein
MPLPSRNKRDIFSHSPAPLNVGGGRKGKARMEDGTRRGHWLLPPPHSAFSKLQLTSWQDTIGEAIRILIIAVSGNNAVFTTGQAEL